MILINFVLFFVLFYGLFCLSKYFFSNLFKTSLNIIFQNNISNLNKKIFSFFLILNITIGLIGIITHFIFLNNYNINFVQIFLVILSLIGIFFSLKKNYFVLEEFKLVFSTFIKNKNIVFYLIILNFIFSLNKSFLPWIDQDEITQYGYYTRLFAEGWVLKDNVWGDFTRFGELIFSSFYFVTKNLVFIKIFKSVLFIGNIFCFYCLIQTITGSKKISSLASLILITIPELSYVGFFSMKTDYMLFSFEIISIILLSLIAYQSVSIKKRYNDLIKILILSLFFSGLAFAVRMSGIYLLILNFIILFYLIYKTQKNKISFKFLFKLFSIISIICIVTFLPNIIFNLLKYNNPLYPINGFWNNFISNSMYLDHWDLNKTKNLHNINIGIPIINEIYILFYNSLGLGRSYLREFTFIFHPNDLASTGWFSPVTLIILLAPLYFKTSKKILIFTLMFLFLFLFWVNGIQYNRVFLASSSISIIILSICMSVKKNLFYFYIGKIIYFLSILSCLILTFYHLDISLRSNPYGVKMLFVDKYMLEDNAIKSFPRSEWDDYLINDPKLFLSIDKKNYRKHSQKILNETFNNNDIKKINEILYENNIDLIIHNFKKFPHLHTLLSKGYILQVDNFDIAQNQLKNINEKNYCFLFQKKFAETNNLKIIFLSKNNVKLMCKL